MRWTYEVQYWSQVWLYFTNTTDDKGHYNTAISWDKTLKGQWRVYLTVLGCSKDGLCLCFKGEEKQKGEFKSDIENENEHNADGK